MPTTTEPKVVEKEPELAKEDLVLKENEEILIGKFPTKIGFVRKFAHLWGKYYRVNYYDRSRNNYITESYFVRILENKKVEIWWDEGMGTIWKEYKTIK